MKGSAPHQLGGNDMVWVNRQSSCRLATFKFEAFAEDSAAMGFLWVSSPVIQSLVGHNGPSNRH